MNHHFRTAAYDVIQRIDDDDMRESLLEQLAGIEDGEAMQTTKAELDAMKDAWLRLRLDEALAKRRTR